MPRIQVTEDKKTKQVKYQMILPKDIMDNLVAQQGDLLILKSVVGNEITFTFKRNQKQNES